MVMGYTAGNTWVTIGHKMFLLAIAMVKHGWTFDVDIHNVSSFVYDRRVVLIVTQAYLQNMIQHSE